MKQHTFKVIHGLKKKSQRKLEYILNWIKIRPKHFKMCAIEPEEGLECNLLLNVLILEEETFNINNLSFYLNVLEKKFILY